MAQDALRKRDLEALLQDCDDTKEAVARVLGKTVRFAKNNPSADLEQLKQIAEAEGSHEASRINQPNALLMDLGVIAPMVGLLGTAIGILRSFGNLASDTTPMKTMILAGGVSQALVATAIGLTVGLTAMFFYAWFRFRVTSVIAYFDRVLTPLLVQTSICLSQGKFKPVTSKEAEAPDKKD
jgi:biopolymer transport protein ExbB